MQNQTEITTVIAGIKDIKNSGNSLYSKLLCNNAIVCCWAEHGQIYKSWSDRYSKHSDNSFCLVPRSNATDKDMTVQTLIERFGISNAELFKSKYYEAINGDGQEWKRISTLHSSSLLALLCFYSVSKDHPLEYKDYRFTESLFEVKTPVLGRHKSNMDVVLRGKNVQTGKHVTLFLESKFSEYLNSGKYDGAYATTEGKSFKWNDDEEVILCEILYRLSKDVDPIDKFGKYSDTYRQLAAVINRKQDTFRMADEVLTYQEIFGQSEFIKEDIVRKFYFL